MSRTITCIACTPPTSYSSDAEYKQHLMDVHGATSTVEAIRMERSKRQNLPNHVSTPQVTIPAGGIPVGPGIEPSPEFIQVVTEAQSSSNQLTPPVIIPSIITVPFNIPTPAIKEIKLQYLYQGDCPDCRTPVRTIMVEAKGELIASAFCISCNKVLKQLTVQPILDPHDRNNGSKANTSVREEMRHLPETSKNNVQNNSGRDTSVGVQRTTRRRSKAKMGRKEEVGDKTELTTGDKKN